MNDIHELISNYLDGVLSKERFAELERWIQSDQRNARQFARDMYDHSGMRDSLAGELRLQNLMGTLPTTDSVDLSQFDDIESRVIEMLLNEEAEAVKSAVNTVNDPEPAELLTNLHNVSYRPEYDRRTRRPEPIVIPWAVVYAFAASVVVAISFLGYRLYSQYQYSVAHKLEVARAPERVAAPAAIVSDSVLLEWSDPSLSTVIGTAIPSGPIGLTAGVVELTFACGAKVIVEAPAQFEVVSSDRLKFDLGKAVGKVPREAVGFTVKANSATVVDLGTEFGVVAEASGESEVHVLDGVVEVVSSSLESPEVGSNTRLLAGKAVGVGQSGEVTPIDPSSQVFHRRIPDVISFSENMFPAADSRLVDADGDGVGDRVDLLDGTTTDEQAGARRKNIPEVGIGEKNDEASPDLGDQRYWNEFNLQTPQLARVPSPEMIDSVEYVVTLAEVSDPKDLSVELIGIGQSENVDVTPESIAETGETLASGVFDATSVSGARMAIDVTDFVRERIREGDTTIAFRLQVAGDGVPNRDGLANSFVVWTSQAPLDLNKPQLVVAARRYSEPEGQAPPTSN